MTNLQIYNNAFIEVFGVGVSELNQDFTAEKVDSWDSMRKLNLMNYLEDEFSIMMDPMDMIAFTSYEIGKAILAKYDIII